MCKIVQCNEKRSLSKHINFVFFSCCNMFVEWFRHVFVDLYDLYLYNDGLKAPVSGSLKCWWITKHINIRCRRAKPEQLCNCFFEIGTKTITKHYLRHTGTPHLVISNRPSIHIVEIENLKHNHDVWKFSVFKMAWLHSTCYGIDLLRHKQSIT
jgi:hypothetical protein